MSSERPDEALVPAVSFPVRRSVVWTWAIYGLILAFIATVPVWPYSVPWGDHPSELIGLALIAVMLRILIGRA